MSRARLFLKYWLPAIIWMAIIFSGSSDVRSYEHSSRLFEPLMHWLFPSMTHVQIEAIHHVVRKCAHLTEYAVLALLTWRAIHQPVRKDPRPWSWREAGVTLLIVFIYAATDEFHQRFVVARTPQISDVFIDAGGAAVALGILWCLDTWRQARLHSEIHKSTEPN